MIKIIAAGALLGLAFASPVFAQDMVCDAASLDKMKVEIEALTDAAKKDASMKAYGEAEAAMKANKMDECKMKMGEASKVMGK